MSDEPSGAISVEELYESFGNGLWTKPDGWFFRAIDNHFGAVRGLLKVKDKLLKEAAEKSKGKTTEQASVIGWNMACKYDQIHTKYYESFSRYGERNPPCNY